MPNMYADRSSAAAPDQSWDPEVERTPPAVVRARLQDPAVQARLQAQGVTPAEIQELPTIYERWIQFVGSKKSFLDRHPTLATALQIGVVAAPAAFLAAPALAGAGGSGGAASAAGTAGATGTAGAGTAAGVLPSTALPLSTGTVAGLSGGTGFGTAAGLGAGAGAGAGAAESVLPATQTVPAATGTLSGVAPSGAVAASSTPSVSSWLGGTARVLGTPGGATLAGVAGNLIGAGIQSSANTKAAEIAAQTAREALAYEKQRDAYAQQLEASRYGDLTGRLAPYISTGQNASARMAAILGLPAPASATSGPPAPTPMGSGPQPTYQTRPGLDTSQPPVGTAIPRPGGPLVTVRAPSGETRQVSPADAQHYVSLGATVVQ